MRINVPIARSRSRFHINDCNFRAALTILLVLLPPLLPPPQNTYLPF